MELFKIWNKKPDVNRLLQLIRTADERPSTENLDTLKSELIQLARKARQTVSRQDPKESRVVKLPPLTTSGSRLNQDDWFVVGDLHGDFNSLCRILLKIYLRPGIEPDKIRIIFLGDYIDRGARPFEVLRLLFSLKIEWPDHFWLLRGNHELLEVGEDSIVRSTVSPADCIEFWKEHVGEDVFKSLSTLFDVLPVAFLQPFNTTDQPIHQSNRNILYIHGGIPRTEYLKLPLDTLECRGGFLWSDPELHKLEVLNGPSRRFSFGSKDFTTFCGHHDISLVVRGHEPRKDGIDLHEEVTGSGHRLVTLFSCGTKENEDSYYGSDILVPRFLQMVANRHQELPLSVEEIYRDDICIAGSLMLLNPQLFQDLVAAITRTLAEETGITFNIKIANQDIRNSGDSTDIHDSNRFSSIVLFPDLPLNGKINTLIAVGNIRSSLTLDCADLATGSQTVVTAIRSKYPIFGYLPEQYFQSEKENHHA